MATGWIRNGEPVDVVAFLRAMGVAARPAVLARADIATVLSRYGITWGEYTPAPTAPHRVPVKLVIRRLAAATGRTPAQVATAITGNARRLVLFFQEPTIAFDDAEVRAEIANIATALSITIDADQILRDGDDV